MLVRTRPFNPVFDRRFDRAFDQLTNSVAATRRTPAVEATSSDGSLVLTVDLPGTPGDAVGVAVTGGVLTLSASTPELSWERTVRLGAALDPETVSASYVDGRLTVTVAPVATVEPRRIEISTTPAAAIEVEVSDESGDQPENGTSDNG